MSCGKYEADIALLAGGDLPGEAVRGLEEHLGKCPECRELLEALRADAAALRDEPVSEIALARMRARVMERVAAPRRPVWRWLIPVPLAAVAATLWLLLQMPPVPPPPVAKVVKPVVPAMPKTEPRVEARRRKPAIRKHATPPAEPLLVKLETDDPQVVIYWIVEKAED
jgi:anti-sigma factor RsiW